MFRYGLLQNELFMIGTSKMEHIFPMTESFHSLVCLWFMLNLKAEMSELDFLNITCTCIHNKEYEMAVFLSLKNVCYIFLHINVLCICYMYYVFLHFWCFSC